MQYKGVLLSVLLFSCVTASRAQYMERGRIPGFKKPAPAATAANTKDVKKEPVLTEAQKCAIEDRKAAQNIEREMKKLEQTRSMVPLAGQKSYFGDMNDYVIDFMKKYLGTHNKTLSVVNDRSKTKFSLIDNVMKKNNIPNQLKYLAVIESALNNKAISNVGAVGPWQFMESTAELMGLTVNKKRDDRTDWYKSTNAAAKYLNFLYSKMNDWLLVIAAYNSGPTPVERAIEKTGSRSFWDIKKYLPRETQGHVLAFIATASIFENLNKFISEGKIPEDYVIHPEMAPAPGEIKASKTPKVIFSEAELKNMSIVFLKQPLCIDILAQELQIDKRMLERWNPDYDLFVMDQYPEEEYRFRIPKDKVDGFVEKKEILTKKSEKYYKDITM